MARDNFVADGKPDAAAFIALLRMEAFEDAKDLAGVLRFDANAVIVNGEDGKVAGGLGGDGDLGSAMGYAELERVRREILKQLFEADGGNGNPGGGSL